MQTEELQMHLTLSQVVYLKQQFENNISNSLYTCMCWMSVHEHASLIVRRRFCHFRTIQRPLKLLTKQSHFNK